MSSCFSPSRAASVVDRGSSAKKSAILVASKRNVAGSCHRIGPSRGPSARTPDAKKLPSAASTPTSFFMWVTKRGPFTANTNPSGVSARHR
ncbi:hypothetical protein ASG69_09770 [Rhodococcus sp. Leaf225]|nr:hypothetical protein ASG69_09770 [Rhodococcus sp. Leaf225]KQU46413.1 hypothetical protein ASH03_06805 [Rhodococcus sp. Leaf258]